MTETNYSFEISRDGGTTWERSSQRGTTHGIASEMAYFLEVSAINNDFPLARMCKAIDE